MRREPIERQTADTRHQTTNKRHRSAETISCDTCVRRSQEYTERASHQLPDDRSVTAAVQGQAENANVKWAAFSPFDSTKYASTPIAKISTCSRTANAHISNARSTIRNIYSWETLNDDCAGMHSFIRRPSDGLHFRWPTFMVFLLQSNTSLGAHPPSPEGAFVEKVNEVSSSSSFLERPISDTLT